MLLSFFDYCIEEVCLLWSVAMLIDFVLAAKEGQNWFEIRGVVGYFHKIWHILIGAAFVVGGLFVFYFPLAKTDWFCGSAYFLYAALSHFLPVCRKPKGRRVFIVSDAVCFAGTAVLSLQTAIAMAYPYLYQLIVADIVVIALALLFFVLNILKNRRKWFALARLFCYGALLFFTVWFL